MTTENKIPPFEIELLLAHILKKSREYVLAHPEIKLSKAQEKRFGQLLKRRKNHEPMAYILGEKEFYGLDFKVTRDTLIPRPETEMLVELVTQNMERDLRDCSELRAARYTIIDVGTGSGNIIISLARSVKRETRSKILFYGADLSPKALRIAKYNAKKNKIDKKIKFIKSNLLEYFINNNLAIQQFNNLIIVANLPYLSKEIYDATAPDIKNFEPQSALLSHKDGLAHYEKLFQQIKKLQNSCCVLRVTCYAEFSPEQKPVLAELVRKYFPASKADFKKDLAGKWRVAIIKL
jgi:release factor glutamine methyltransferase